MTYWSHRVSAVPFDANDDTPEGYELAGSVAAA